jgi:hypothetical protein
MQRFVGLLFLAASASLAFAEDKDKAAAAPTEKLQKHLGPVVIDYLGRVTKDEAFRVGELDPTKFGETGWIAGRAVAGKPSADSRVRPEGRTARDPDPVRRSGIPPPRHGR